MTEKHEKYLIIDGKRNNVLVLAIVDLFSSEFVNTLCTFALITN